MKFTCLRTDLQGKQTMHIGRQSDKNDEPKEKEKERKKARG